MSLSETGKKRIAILGSTGSVGTQTLEVIQAYPDLFSAEVLVAFSNWKLLVRQALAVQPRAVVIADAQHYHSVRQALNDTGVQVYAGQESVDQITESTDIDLVVLAMVGAAGLRPALRAAESGKHLALANKESLVVGGAILIETARRNRVRVLPIDSEHSAIFQCLGGERTDTVEKVILTASGGPFRHMTAEQLREVTPAQALKHPNWSMGCKISIDSATLMNKGLELIEARWLFDLRPEQLDVVIHPESVIHSLVQFWDGSVKAQLGLPDMKLPILFALSWPGRVRSSFPRFSFADHPRLNFEAADSAKFRNLALASEALRKEGNLPCVMNAANEVAVDAFLKNRIRFTEIPDCIEQVMSAVVYLPDPDLNALFDSDREARARARDIIK